MVLVSVQDRCTVYAKCSLGSQIVLEAPNGTPRKQGSSGSTFSPFGDRCTVCSKSTIGLQIIFDAPNGTPRCVGHLESRFSPFVDGVSVSPR
jgi:hypothetical protein